jgi:hypothetical protein
MAFGDRPRAPALRYGFNRPAPRPAPRLTPEQIEQLGIEVAPVEPEPEEQQSDEAFAESLRADVDRWRATPKPDPLNFPPQPRRRRLLR